MQFKTIKFELRDDGIGILSLNRPEKLNAISFEMEEELHQVLDHLMIDLNCRVLILRGEGRSFSAGTDLQEGLILNSKKKPEGYDQFYYLNVPEPLKKKIISSVEDKSDYNKDAKDISAHYRNCAWCCRRWRIWICNGFRYENRL